MPMQKMYTIKNDAIWGVVSAKGKTYEIELTVEQIDEVDYEKLRKLMEVNGWVWVNVKFKDGKALLVRVDDLWNLNAPELNV